MCFLWARVCGCSEKPWEDWETGESVGIVETGVPGSKRDTAQAGRAGNHEGF